MAVMLYIWMIRTLTHRLPLVGASVRGPSSPLVSFRWPEVPGRGRWTRCRRSCSEAPDARDRRRSCRDRKRPEIERTPPDYPWCTCPWQVATTSSSALSKSLSSSPTSCSYSCSSFCCFPSSCLSSYCSRYPFASLRTSRYPSPSSSCSSDSGALPRTPIPSFSPPSSSHLLIHLILSLLIRILSSLTSSPSSPLTQNRTSRNKIWTGSVWSQSHIIL